MGFIYKEDIDGAFVCNHSTTKCSACMTDEDWASLETSGIISHTGIGGCLAGDWKAKKFYCDVCSEIINKDYFYGRDYDRGEEDKEKYKFQLD
jgi:hypothetical protein